ncbi:MAG: MerR family transcriptional regulator, heat shock protein HspR [Acidobacteriota bacterium]|nr:MerR family transcriptional regulator, heat shock protein HspR [Acidobacteriota bacterium]
MISIISERYNIHPQTLRLYEREGLIKPVRTSGNTRLYGEDEIRKLEMILTLTRDLGVNLAGVEVVLQLARMMNDGNMEFGRLLDFIRQTMLDKRHGIARENALVKAVPMGLARRR